MQDARDVPRLPLWASLRLRLPLSIAALIVSIVGLFLWTATREIEHAVLANGGERARIAAEQIASLLAQSTTRTLNEAHRLASADVVRRYLHVRSEADGIEVHKRLSALAAANQPPVELLDGSRQRVLEVRVPASAPATAIAPESDAPTHTGVGPFRNSNGIISYDVVVAVPSDRPTAAGQEEPQRLGFVRVPRTLSARQTLDLIGRLVGTGSLVLVGNQAGDLWTNLSTEVPAPPLGGAGTGITEYRPQNGLLYVGNLAPVDDKPWAVWVGFPRDSVLVPATLAGRRMLVIGACFVAISAVLGTVLSGRITTPLTDLTTASETIAAGDYSRRVTNRRRDEIGRLAGAFNTMAAHVEQGHQALEERVRQRTARLEAAMKQLDQFFSLSIDLLCIADVEGRFLRVNPSWETVLGWTPSDLTSVPYLDFVHPEDQSATQAEAGKLAEGQVTVSFENRYRCRDGSYRWLSWKAAALPEEGLVFAAARDVTEKKRLAQELQQHVAEAKAVNQELEAFTHSVSHDLRAPLRHVIGFAGLLEDSAKAKLDDENRRHLGVITAAASRMGRLIDDLLAFSRLGRAAPTIQRIRLTDLVRDARQEVTGGTEDQRVRWTIHPLPEIDADPSMLRLVIVNLLGNALKYTQRRADPVIEIGSESSAGEVVVFVRDNGVGFDMKYAHKLFGVFQRLHSTDEFEGTGIGLANVRRIIHRHGGRTWAEGAVDHGATFYFSLPVTAGGAST